MASSLTSPKRWSKHCAPTTTISPAAKTDAGQTSAPTVLILFDGVCGLCHGLVQFLIRRDGRDRLRFAPLQGPTAAALLARHGKDPSDLDTVYVIEHAGTPREIVWDRARGVLLAMGKLGGVWRLSALLLVMPDLLLNSGYRLVASVRYRIFGKLDACPVPSMAQRAKFLP